MAYFSSFTGFLFFGETFGGVVGPRSGTHPIRLSGREVDAAGQRRAATLRPWLKYAISTASARTPSAAATRCAWSIHFA